MTFITNRRYASAPAKFKSRWNIFQFLRDRDNFGKEVPSFNIKGQSHVNTVAGGFLTILILTVAFSYGTTKLADLVRGKNPNVTLSTEPDYYDLESQLNLGESKFRIAFGAVANRS